MVDYISINGYNVVEVLSMTFKEYLNQKNMSILKLSKSSGIPYATLYNSLENPESIKLENLKKIAAYLNITLDELSEMFAEHDKTQSLLSILKEQKDIKLKSNLYHNTQIKFAYNSNRIEGSKLTEDETRYIYETNSIIGDKPSTNINDIVEVANHFYLFDVILETAKEVLSENLIKEYHRILKNGTVDSRNAWFNVGGYKKHPNEVGGKMTTDPKLVSKEMKKLLSWYNTLNDVELEDVVEFHYRFESIHPFQDGNGRIGRIISFKECLKHNIMPFIIEDEYKAFYYRGLSEFESERGFLMETCLSMQDNYEKMVKLFLPEYL